MDYMYLHKFDDHYLISKTKSQTLIPYSHLLISIKASLKTGLPVIIQYSDCSYDLKRLTSKHFHHCDEFSFVNTSQKNRFQTQRNISNPTEMVEYMLELSTQLS